MPPKKNKNPQPPSQSPEKVATRAVAHSSGRVTRAAAMRASESGAPVYFTELSSPTRKRKTKEPKQEDASSSNSNTTIVIEHCTQSDSFEKKATEVKEGLESKIPNITVLVNPKKPRKGCFEIRQEGGEKFISLLKMKDPFQPMIDLDMKEVIKDITDKINELNVNP